MKFLQTVSFFLVAQMAAADHGVVPLQPFCGVETLGTNPLTGASGFCQHKELTLPTKDEVCAYSMDSPLSYGKVATSDAGTIDVAEECPTPNPLPPRRELHQCEMYHKVFEDGVDLDTSIPDITKCQLKRGGGALKYEPNFPKDRPDVYIEVELNAPPYPRFQFYPALFPNWESSDGKMASSDSTGYVPVLNKTVYDILYWNQPDEGGTGFKFRYISKNGPGAWEACSYSPIAFDLGMDGTVGHIVDETNGFKIDITGDGEIEHLKQWFAPTEGILIDAHNVDGLDDYSNGIITGDHLMGDMAGTYTDGYAKLKTYDYNCDNKLTGEELEGLYIWVDKNSNLKLDNPTVVDDDAGELFTLGHFGIVALNTIHNNLKSYAVLADGTRMLMHDLWFDGFDERRRLRSRQLEGTKWTSHGIEGRRLLEDERRLGKGKGKDEDKGKGKDEDKGKEDDENVDDGLPKNYKRDWDVEEVAQERDACEYAILCAPGTEQPETRSGNEDPSCGASPVPSSVTYGTYGGNPQCHSGGSDTPLGFDFGWKMTGCTSGTYTLNTGGEIKGSCGIADKITLNVQCNADKSATISWSGEGSSNVAIKMKGGNGGTLYDASTNGSDFITGRNGGGNIADISHIEVCVNCVGADCYKTPLTTDPVTNPPPTDPVTNAPPTDPITNAPPTSCGDNAWLGLTLYEVASQNIPYPYCGCLGQEEPLQGQSLFNNKGECHKVNICHGNAGHGWNKQTVSRASLDPTKTNGHAGFNHNKPGANKRPDYFPGTKSVPNPNGAGKNSGMLDGDCGFQCASEEFTCADGTVVTRTLPDCDFAACPSAETDPAPIVTDPAPTEKDQWMWLNGEALDQREAGEFHHEDVSGFLLRHKHASNREARFYFGEGEVLMIKSFHEFLRVERRLSEGISEDVAEKACGHLSGDDKKSCIYDVLATQDTSMAKAW
ncbi:Hemolysin-type calcium-binding [Seminavis robusta]|uniref:Hemolysin-type calcium-binding n=1 Tax=Seminavis robusta TaxID=568900 RepID=A0A9N8DNK0_9STRA|nr:Hemolysin-type calcium-binding [Seminavis robusta]|eukprot:Sro178_g078200.1 Hemolysin-type calcium-binding (944) ;mRNA; r:57379-60787